MSGTGQRPNHQSRLDWWRGQFQRHQKSNLSIALFCRQLGVSVATFYYWKRRVHEATLGPTPRGLPWVSDHRRPIPSADGAVANFVPVSVLDPGAGTELEIELTNACVVRLRGAIDPPLLHAAITAVGQLAALAKEPTDAPATSRRRARLSLLPAHRHAQELRWRFMITSVPG